METATICKNCGNSFYGKYCNRCGEKVYTQHDKKISHLLEEAVHFITHLDGTLLLTIRTMFTRPGQYALDYCEGTRKKYFKPVSLFLLLVILYLLFPAFEMFNMKLKYHVGHSAYGKYATQKVAEATANKHLSAEQAADIFHRAGEKTSKFLLFIILPFSAFISWLLAYKKRKFYFDHFVFTTEIASFLLLWGFLLFPLFINLVYWLSSFVLVSSERQTGIGIVSIFSIYLLFAARRFFKFNWLYTLLYSAVFAFTLFWFIEYVYKFLLFVITYYISLR